MKRLPRFVRRAFAAGAATCFASTAFAAGPSADLRTLERIQRASQTLDYSGIFVYQDLNRMQSSRITHKAGANGALEKLELLDGVPREVLRTGDETRCLIPSTQTVLIERGATNDAFPALLRTPPSSVAEFYRITRDGSDRVAGLECAVLVLDPKDKLRYGYRLCADEKTGLLLRAQTFNERADLVEQIAFSEVKIGGPIELASLKPSWDTQGWKVEQASGISQVLPKWSVGEAVSGFKKIREVRRAVDGKPDVGQFVFSDGLSAISVFIEPWQKGQPEQEMSSAQGALNMLSRRRGEWLVTVLGEVPGAAIRRFADAVEFKSPTDVR